MTNDLAHSSVPAGEALREEGESWLDTPKSLSGSANTILLAEDDENDIFMMKMACDRTGIPHQLHIVTDGTMAIDYLFGKGHFANRVAYPLPAIIFLDINMPQQNGFEVLKLARAKPELKKIPVIMFSNSTFMADVDRAYQLGVTSYMRKIPSLTEFRQAISVILNYWLQPKAQPLGAH